MPNSRNWRTWSRADWASADPDDVPDDCTPVAWRNMIRREQGAPSRGRAPRTEARDDLSDALRLIRGGPEPRSVTAKDVPADVRASIVADAKIREREAAAEMNSPKNKALRAQILAEVDAIEADKARAMADRALAARGGLRAITAVPEPQPHYSSVRVNDEPATYGPGSSFSYIRDRFIEATWSMGNALPPRGRGDGIATVRARLTRHAKEVSYLARRGDDATRALIRDSFVEKARPYHLSPADHSHENFRMLVFAEFRADSTAMTSMGSFAPPVFLLQDWLKWRTAAAPAASRAGSRPLPPTGMTIDVPGLTSGVAMGVQATENSAVTSSTPTATYRSAPVLTIAGKVSISQQSLDRMGISADQIIAEQAAREAATTLDSEVLTKIIAALPTSHKISNSGTAGVPALWADVAESASKLTTTEGTRLAPDTVLMPPLNGAWFRAQVDTQKRPIWTPSAAGVAARIGQPDTSLEGYTGYDVQGSCVYEDANLAPTSTHATLVVGNFARGVLVMTGAPIVDVWPEVNPAALTAIVTIRQYAAIAVQYSSAFCRISGSAYATAPTFTGA